MSPNLRRAALVAAAVLVCGGALPAPARADEGPAQAIDHRVDLNADAVSALLGSGGSGGVPPIDQRDPAMIDQAAGTICPPGQVHASLTATLSDGSRATVILPCTTPPNMSDVRSRVGQQVEAAAALNRAAIRFDPKVRGLVGLRTWIEVDRPDSVVLGLTLGANRLTAIARVEQVQLVVDGVPLAPVVGAQSGAPVDPSSKSNADADRAVPKTTRIGPYVFTRAGTHRVEVRVRWRGEWVLKAGATPQLFGELSPVDAPALVAAYTVVDAQARLR